MKNENFFKKLEYLFSVESTKIENAAFLYKIVLSGANANPLMHNVPKWSDTL